MDEPAPEATAEIADIEVYVNDQLIGGPFGARLRRGHVWVPVREVVAALGGQSDLRIANRTMTLRLAGKQTALTLDDPKRAVLLGSTPMARAEALAELLGAEYQWDEEQRRVSLRRQPAAEPERPRREPQGTTGGILDLTLSDLSGGRMPLRRLAGRRSVLFIWASWSESRERLAEWQSFHSDHRDTGFRLLAVACDGAGAQAAKPYADRARLGRSAALDERNLLGERLGFKSLPRTYLVDEQGSVVEAEDDLRRIAQWVTGGRRGSRGGGEAQVSPRESLQAIEKRLRGDPDNGALRLRFADALADAGEWARATRQYRRAAESSSPTAIALYRLGVALLKQGKSRQAVAPWRQALKIEPDNEIIKKQIWALEHPERFYRGAIDLDWQRRQNRPRRRRG
jgi:tetratricopeptide (TPR) repeat protein